MKSLYLAILSLLLFSCSDSALKIENVASIQGQQLTGVTVSKDQRIFINFPRWRPGVKHSVEEIKGEERLAYPDASWNDWSIGQRIHDSVFVAVQSVVAHEDILYVLDTRNPLFQGVQGAPKVFVFDLNTDKLQSIYTLSEEVYFQDSYINDLRVDIKNNRIYFTDSGHAGLLILDPVLNRWRRILTDHPSTQSEVDELLIGGKLWKNKVHSDGIALDEQRGLLYFHALTGYTLYSLPTDELWESNTDELEEGLQAVATTSAPDGMIFFKDKVYMADLEHNSIIYYDLETQNTQTLIKSPKIRWADTFSVYKDRLYFTNSRIDEAGTDIQDMEFSLDYIELK